jgi:hypothetical protein
LRNFELPPWSIVQVFGSFIRSRQTGATSADDHNGRGVLPGRGGRSRCDLFSDKDRIALSLYLPALNRVERRSAKRFAGPQAEAGVMPWATHFIANKEALG